MDDFTKIKLINNLIELVSHFYEKKHSSVSITDIKYLKGFCEGVAYTLVETKIIDDSEAKRILQGLGKKRAYIKQPVKQDIKEDQTLPIQDPVNDLDVPTIFRKEAERKIS